MRRFHLLNRSLFPLLITLIFGLGAWTSLHFHATLPLHAQASFQLSAAQATALKALHAPVTVTLFSNQNALNVRAQATLPALKAHLPTLKFRIINPDTDAENVARFNITRAGETLIQLADKTQRIPLFNVPDILQAVLSLSSRQQGFIVALTGNGERDFLADSGGSWQALFHELQNSHLPIASINLAQTAIPSNTNLLIAADPVPEQLQPFASKIRAYLQRGGNLLYTTDTLHPGIPLFLSQLTGLTIAPGVIVDKTAFRIGYSDPRILPAEINTQVPWLATLSALPILPGSVAIQDTGSSTWQRQILLKSSAQSWAETSPINGHIAKDDNELAGPLPVAWSLSRPFAGKTQSIVVLGDSDLWVGNALHLGGNAAFAQALISKLSQTTLATHITRPPRADQFINLSLTAMLTLGSLLLIGFPLLAWLSVLWFRYLFRKHYRL